MKIDDSTLFQKPRDFIKNEFKTLKFLKDDSQIGKYFAQLSRDAGAYYDDYHERAGKSKISSVRFESNVAVALNKRPGACHIGCIISEQDGKIEELSYYIALCKLNKAGKNTLIRKYHFDYARSGKKHRQPHPVFHIQYPGELSPRLSSIIRDDHLNPWLSEPRLCYAPMTLALVLNLVFREFPSEVSTKIIERAEWRDLIRNNEDTILKPYYYKCNQFITSPAGKLITNDFFYGK